jgi:hypothetical protein
MIQNDPAVLEAAKKLSGDIKQFQTLNAAQHDRVIAAIKDLRAHLDDDPDRPERDYAGVTTDISNLNDQIHNFNVTHGELVPADKDALATIVQASAALKAKADALLPVELTTTTRQRGTGLGLGTGTSQTTSTPTTTTTLRTTTPA